MDPVLDRVARGQHQDVGRRVAQAQPPQHLETVDVRQADVEHDQPVRRGAQRLVGLEPCLGPIDRMPRAGEHAREPLGEQRIVFDDEDAHRSLRFDSFHLGHSGGYVSKSSVFSQRNDSTRAYDRKPLGGFPRSGVQCSQFGQ